MYLGYENQGYSYYIDGKVLDTVDQEKGLEILIAKDLKESQQCIQAYGKASRMLGAINRTIKHKDKYIYCRICTNHWLDLIWNTLCQPGLHDTPKTKSYWKKCNTDLQECYRI